MKCFWLIIELFPPWACYEASKYFCHSGMDGSTDLWLSIWHDNMKCFFKMGQIQAKPTHDVGCTGLKSTKVKVHRITTEPFKFRWLRCRYFIFLTVEPREAREESIHSILKKIIGSCWEKCSVSVFDKSQKEMPPKMVKMALSKLHIGELVEKKN